MLGTRWTALLSRGSPHTHRSAASPWRPDALGTYTNAARESPARPATVRAGLIGRRVWAGLLITVALAGCTDAAPREAPAGSLPGSPTAPATVTATATSITSTPTAVPSSIPVGPAADWTVIRTEHVQRPERYRFTVAIGGQERTFDGSRVCYEVAVPGQVLPERIQTAIGYEVECRLEN